MNTAFLEEKNDYGGDLTKFEFPNRSLYDGFADYRMNKGSKHAIEEMQKNYLRSEEKKKMYRASIAYGLHMPLKMKIERELLCQSQRLPGGMKSSLLGIEILMGKDTTIDYDEILNTNEYSPENNYSCNNLHDSI